VNAHVEVLPDISVALHVTVVIPIGNIDPDAGTHDAVTPGQLSDNIGGGYVTTTPCAPGFPAVVVTLAGHTIAGACRSTTVTVNVHCDVLPDASVAVAVTVVVPLGNVDPDAGLATTVTPGQLSVAVTT
jgi:hypothetical protein